MMASDSNEQTPLMTGQQDAASFNNLHIVSRTSRF